MIDFGFYNMDCMEGMKEFPDKYFDLAIVDPPYGDAKHIESSQFVQVERERESNRFAVANPKQNNLRFHGGSKNGEKDPWNKYRQLYEQAAHGRVSTAKKL